MLAVDGAIHRGKSHVRRDPVAPQDPQENRLPAISAGAVFGAANRYIGNAPDFTTKSVVERRNIQMPEFLGHKRLPLLFRTSIFRGVTPIFFK
jgi:Na+/H+ antiporter NhaD/arsenite permease-like protein